MHIHIYNGNCFQLKGQALLATMVPSMVVADPEMEEMDQETVETDPETVETDPETVVMDQ